jgi:hypothetical protein
LAAEFRNSLFAALSTANRRLLAPDLEPATLALGQTIGIAEAVYGRLFGSDVTAPRD